MKPTLVDSFHSTHGLEWFNKMNHPGLTLISVHKLSQTVLNLKGTSASFSSTEIMFSSWGEWRVREGQWSRRYPNHVTLSFCLWLGQVWSWGGGKQRGVWVLLPGDPSPHRPDQRWGKG